MVKVEGGQVMPDFCIGKYVVTQKLWENVMGGNQSPNKDPNAPITHFTEEDLLDFLAILNDHWELNFRLPTTEQWAFAFKGGLKSKGFIYAGSNDPNEVAWYVNNGNINIPNQVGQKLPNELGLYDMSGNVWELCQNKTGAYDYQGGFFASSKQMLTPSAEAYISLYDAIKSVPFLGLRLVCDPVDPLYGLTAGVLRVTLYGLFLFQIRSQE